MARSPEALERNRVLSREAKRRRCGTCEECGAETRYGGKPGMAVARLCLRCANVKKGLERRGNGFRQQKLHTLLAANGEMRFSDIVSAFGISSQQVFGLLLREREAGRVKRVARGRYGLADGSR
jgi:hypothetical protein